MKKFATAVGAAMLSVTSMAHAGGLDIMGTPYGAMFEDGYYGEISLKYIKTNISGTYSAALGGGSTGGMGKNLFGISAAFKGDISRDISYAVFLGTPYAGDAEYTQGVYSGLRAEWRSLQLAALARYKLDSGVSIYGGARVVRSSANINIPDTLIRTGLEVAGAGGNSAAATVASSAPAGTLSYSAKADDNIAFGYILGAAYEKPDMALRVALTYESSVKHRFDTTESMAFFSGGLAGTNAGSSRTSITLPQSVTLDAQTGVAKDVLVFGSIRYAAWSDWKVRPIGYATLTGSDVTSFSNNVVTYTLGAGYRVTPEISAFVRGSYEKENGGVATRIAPVDGKKSLGIGGKYSTDNINIGIGVEYVWFGNATDSSGTTFSKNSAIGVGASVGVSF